ncbi:FCD domain-containing protein, partial [Streptomyces sp. SID5789]|uniref:FadR/GntR family transcriptional regulator n=1 Tax=Streptomyces sp. SID5789 TaxID=2690310 RepID=UPI00136F3BC7
GEEDPDPARAVAADLAFHRALLAATHNELLERMEMVISSGLAHRDRIVHSSPHSGDPVPAHRAVLDAVRDRDPRAAEAAMRALLDQAGRDQERIGNPDGKGDHTSKGKTGHADHTERQPH